MPKLPKELEKAVLSLPSKDKDKLLIKLIGKSELLIQQLHFQLLEDESDLKIKREEIRNSILRISKMYHDTPGWMMMDMRELNGRITHHVKVTKDKYGEVELTLYLLNSFFQNQLTHLEYYSGKTDSIALYIAKRTEFILNKLPKLHPDYYVEFERDINKLLENVHNYCPSFYAKQLMIAKNWEY
ncbi:hypothetical protein EMA8858_02163 [Emticicia aquatica]|jgi:hypothetical protein|uniref:Uncharacterized protein n=1 Tax=Emticicia aquatica TaxID=1681835 RepID=A0ABM9AQE1_9BACT|nr:hypothetical protein [Emticicia aquatica]CAH0996033.1 hypothetical protein EMA8858_02163 [Emticicia aquatica]